jgi:hypothetical protein
MSRDRSLPRVRCDFNGAIDSNTWPLVSHEAMARLGMELKVGMRVVAYSEDGFETSNEPAWMSCEGDLIDMPGWGLALKADPDSFRWEPRSDDTFRG